MKTIRRVLQEGQIPRTLQENATRKSSPQASHRTRAKPLARMPQSMKRLNPFSIYRGILEEWYSFAESPRDRVTVLATVDEAEYEVKDEIAMGEDHPVIWHHKVGEGTVFYSALGHQASAYDEPEHQAMLEGAMVWLLK